MKIEFWLGWLIAVSVINTIIIGAALISGGHWFLLEKFYPRKYKKDRLADQLIDEIKAIYGDDFSNFAVSLTSNNYELIIRKIPVGKND